MCGSLSDAARAAGLKVGFYYSMLDWHEPMYETNLPKFVDEFMFAQVRELCTNYGPLDCVWFDGEWDHPAADWRAPELVRMIRELQPAALVNDRLGLGERGVTRLCDFYTREQPSEINVAMGFEREKPYPWEACMTIGEYWQYSIKDTQFKSTAELVRMLVDVVSRGGNLLLNVGPDTRWRDSSAAGRADAGHRRVAGHQRRRHLRHVRFAVQDVAGRKMHDQGQPPLRSSGPTAGRAAAVAGLAEHDAKAGA